MKKKGIVRIGRDWPKISQQQKETSKMPSVD